VADKVITMGRMRDGSPEPKHGATAAEASDSGLSAGAPNMPAAEPPFHSTALGWSFQDERLVQAFTQNRRWSERNLPG
jgi:hypothetical protein